MGWGKEKKKRSNKKEREKEKIEGKGRGEGKKVPDCILVNYSREGLWQILTQV